MALTLDVLVLFWLIPIFKIIEKTEKITFEFLRVFSKGNSPLQLFQEITTQE